MRPVSGCGSGSSDNVNEEIGVVADTDLVEEMVTAGNASVSDDGSDATGDGAEADDAADTLHPDADHPDADYPNADYPDANATASDPAVGDNTGGATEHTDGASASDAAVDTDGMGDSSAAGDGDATADNAAHSDDALGDNHGDTDGGGNCAKDAETADGPRQGYQRSTQFMTLLAAKNIGGAELVFEVRQSWSIETCLNVFSRLFQLHFGVSISIAI